MRPTYRKAEAIEIFQSVNNESLRNERVLLYHFSSFHSGCQRVHEDRIERKKIYFHVKK